MPYAETEISMEVFTARVHFSIILMFLTNAKRPFSQGILKRNLKSGGHTFNDAEFNEALANLVKREYIQLDADKIIPNKAKIMQGRKKLMKAIIGQEDEDEELVEKK